MKIETLESRVPEQWRFFLTSSLPTRDHDNLSLSSETSTLLVHDHVKGDTVSCRGRRRGGGVCIREDRNVYYEAVPEDSAQHARHLSWYSSLDMDVFRAETRIDARATLAQATEDENEDGDDWPLRLEQVYLNFCEQQRQRRPQQQHHQRSVSLPPASPAMVGLERRMLVRTVAKDRDVRRERLLRHFRFIEDTVSDPEQQAYLMSLASKASSQPGRLYAAFCANWWWQDGQDA